MSKPHGKSKEDLARMKMSELLQLVKNHNLAKHIHLYRRMKKAELVESLAKYKSSVPIKASASAMKATPSPPETPIRMKVPPRAPKKPVAAVARIRKPAPVVKSKKTAKPKGKVRRNPPLYTKEEGGGGGSGSGTAAAGVIPSATTSAVASPEPGRSAPAATTDGGEGPPASPGQSVAG